MILLLDLVKVNWKLSAKEIAMVDAIKKTHDSFRSWGVWERLVPSLVDDCEEFKISVEEAMGVLDIEGELQ